MKLISCYRLGFAGPGRAADLSAGLRSSLLLAGDPGRLPLKETLVLIKMRKPTDMKSSSNFSKLLLLDLYFSVGEMKAVNWLHLFKAQCQNKTISKT
jgi:hypothetical protein